MPIVDGVEYLIRDGLYGIELPAHDCRIRQDAGVWTIATSDKVPFKDGVKAWRMDRADIAALLPEIERLREDQARTIEPVEIEYGKRSELKAIFGQRLRFSGTFERYGTKHAYQGRGPDLTTVLLKDVKTAADGKVVTDHLWFNLTVEFDDADLQEGDVVSFDARVDSYTKGLEGYGYDYKLSRPTRVFKEEGKLK